LGQLVATLLGIVLILPASVILFQQGVWLTFALPLLAIQAHAWFDLLREHRELAALESPQHSQKDKGADD
jgi:hypothetical protein